MKMPNSLAAAALIIPFIPGHVFGGEGAKPSNTRMVPPSSDFNDHLNGHSDWDFGKGLVLGLRMNDGNTEFVGPDGKVLHSVNGPEHVREAVISESGNCVLFAIWRNGNYSHLIRVMASQGRLDFGRFWQEGGNLVPGHRWWVRELGAISEDGGTVLVNLGEDGHAANRILYRWQTWRLDPAKRIGIGLSVANGSRGE